MKVLGQGSEGTARLLKSTRSGKKILRKTAHSFEMSYDLPREVKILKQQLDSHPRIIDLLNWKLEYDSSFSAKPILNMDFAYYSDGDLGQFKNGGLAEEFLWHVFTQTAEALAYLHTGYVTGEGKPPSDWQTVLHRDLKPDNILLKAPRTRQNPFPGIVLGDFGHAITKESATASGDALWQPLELCCSRRSDVWSLGATIHMLAHGRPPVDDMPRRYRGSWFEWMRDPRARNPTHLSRRYSKKLDVNMMTALTRDPLDRVSSLRLLKNLRDDCDR